MLNFEAFPISYVIDVWEKSLENTATIFTFPAIFTIVCVCVPSALHFICCSFWIYPIECVLVTIQITSYHTVQHVKYRLQILVDLL